MEVRSFYSVDDNTCLLAGAEQEGPAHNPWSTHGPHPVKILLFLWPAANPSHLGNAPRPRVRS